MTYLFSKLKHSAFWSENGRSFFPEIKYLKNLKKNRSKQIFHIFLHFTKRSFLDFWDYAKVGFQGSMLMEKYRNPVVPPGGFPAPRGVGRDLVILSNGGGYEPLGQNFPHQHQSARISSSYFERVKQTRRQTYIIPSLLCPSVGPF